MTKLFDIFCCCFFKSDNRSGEEDFENYDFISMKSFSPTDSEQELEDHYRILINKCELLKKILSYKDIIFQELIKILIRRQRANLITEFTNTSLELQEFFVKFFLELTELRQALSALE